MPHPLHPAFLFHPLMPLFGLMSPATATWILATPALDYALADLWPSHFYGWSLLPWMVLFLRRAGSRALTVTAAWEGLIAVSVPAGIAEVELRYRPRLVMALTALSWLALAGVVLTLAVRRARASAPA